MDDESFFCEIDNFDCDFEAWDYKFSSATSFISSDQRD